MDENIGIKNDLKKAPKTGDWGFMRPEIDKSKCIGCK
jgi:Pyruvate/2-oxoacid:ferredoxin oxidoreductase delta subunit